MAYSNILKVNNLSIRLRQSNFDYRLVNNVSFTLRKVETLGIVGESGSGKSVTALSILKLFNSKRIDISAGQICYQGTDITNFSEKEMQTIRGREISMIFQESMSSLNPLTTIGTQVMRVLKLHKNISKKALQLECIDLLDRVGILNPKKTMHTFPHQCSGGMLQRIMIAIAIASSPKILIADEPTTALDYNIKMQIIDLLESIQKELQMSIILISHDLNVIKKMCDKVLVMYCGNIVEENKKNDILNTPVHPYTKCLIESSSFLYNPKDFNEKYLLKGMLPDLDNIPKGCVFHNRCPKVEEKCKGKHGRPKFEQKTNEGKAACFYPIL